MGDEDYNFVFVSTFCGKKSAWSPPVHNRIVGQDIEDLKVIWLRLDMPDLKPWRYNYFGRVLAAHEMAPFLIALGATMQFLGQMYVYFWSEYQEMLHNTTMKTSS